MNPTPWHVALIINKAGIEAMMPIICLSQNMGISYLTFFMPGFKQDNIELLDQWLKKQIDFFVKNNIRLSFIGENLHFDEIAQLTKVCDKLKLIFAINYSSQKEILHAINHILEDVKEKKISVKKIENHLVEKYLYTHGFPDPDLIIFSGKEKKMQDFYLWQVSYSEIYDANVLWPDFKEQNFIDAVNDYKRRERRYGDIGVGKERVF